MKARDERTFCYRCARDMYSAKIEMYQVGGERDTCDKCNYHKTRNYVIKQKNSSGALTP